eukprot:4650524-Prymnesium_polylepis.1
MSHPASLPACNSLDSSDQPHCGTEAVCVDTEVLSGQAGLTTPFCSCNASHLREPAPPGTFGIYPGHVAPFVV